MWMASSIARSFQLKMTLVVKKSTILMDMQMAGAQCFKNTIASFFFLFLHQNICCGYSKEPKHRLILIGTKTIIASLRTKCLPN